jgi:transcription antitermination factor NusG
LTSLQTILDPSAVRSAYFEPRWYAAYTCANQEKRVADQLTERSTAHFLPLYQTLRRWKDRHMRLELPLFPGYVFVRIALRDQMQVLQLPRVVRLVGFGGHPSPLPDGDVELLRKLSVFPHGTEPHAYLTVGRRVRINGGPLAGLEGIIVRRKGNLRFVLSIDLITRSVVADVDAMDLVAIRPAATAKDSTCDIFSRR